MSQVQAINSAICFCISLLFTANLKKRLLRLFQSVQWFLFHVHQGLQRKGSPPKIF